MNHLDTMEEGGYPFDDISIAFLQKMHDDRDSFIHATFGDNRIVKGIILNTQTNVYSDGLITVDGKLYHFIGGAPNTKISKVKVETTRAYEDGNQKKAFINEFYVLGTSGTDAIDFSDLKRWYENQPSYKEIKILGRNVTNEELAGTGWFLADGQNGTDYLIDNFFVVAGNSHQVTATGGEAAVSLTSPGQNAPHKHNVLGIKGGDNSDNSNETRFAGGDKTQNESSFFFTNTEAIEESGGTETHNNLPPFFAVVAIQFIGI